MYICIWWEKKESSCHCKDNLMTCVKWGPSSIDAFSEFLFFNTTEWCVLTALRVFDLEAELQGIECIHPVSKALTKVSPAMLYVCPIYIPFFMAVTPIRTAISTKAGNALQNPNTYQYVSQLHTSKRKKVRVTVAAAWAAVAEQDVAKEIQQSVTCVWYTAGTSRLCRS